MRDPIRHFVSEFIGTFALVFVGGGAIMVTYSPGGPGGLIEVALAHGLILAVMVTALMRISGHFNPAVTLGFLVTRRIEAMMAGVYIVSQLLGAMAGAYALKATMPAAVFAATRGGGQAITLDITGTQAFLLEAIATFFLVLVIFGTAVDPKAPKVGGFAIGPLTGGSLNPARSFGPAVASGVYEAQLIFWTGPIVGGVIAAVLYEFLFLRMPPEPVDHGAVRPAYEKPERK